MVQNKTFSAKGITDFCCCNVCRNNLLRFYDNTDRRGGIRILCKRY